MGRDFREKLFCFIICLSLALSVAVSASSAGCEFSLSQAQVKRGRLFTISLECKADREVCAFIAEVEYDADAVEYRSASVTDARARCSVNVTEAGLVRLVYLCEEGADCSGKSPLAELKFKALESGEFPMSLSVMQVVDGDASDVQVSKAEGTLVQVDAPTESDNGSGRKESVKSDKTEAASAQDEPTSTSSEEESANSNSYTSIEKAEYDVILIVASVAAVLVLLCLVGYCAYKYGVKAATKNKEHVPIDGKSDDMQDE